MLGAMGSGEFSRLENLANQTEKLCDLSKRKKVMQQKICHRVHRGKKRTPSESFQQYFGSDKL